MDPTWGVVIVSVVGVAGTVLATWTQSRHSRRLAREQRDDERRMADRAALLAAYKLFMVSTEEWDRTVREGVDIHEQLNLTDAINLAEANLSVVATPTIAQAARRLTDLYVSREAEISGTRKQKDELASEVRAALNPLGISKLDDASLELTTGE
jgi:hypothetical protein